MDIITRIIPRKGDLVKMYAKNPNYSIPNLPIWKYGSPGDRINNTIPNNIIALVVEDSDRFMVKIMYQNIIGYTYADYVKEIYNNHE